MSALTRTLLVCVLFAVPGLAAADNPTDPKPAGPAVTPPGGAPAATMAPDEAADPALKALREEVNRLRKAADEAESAAGDDVARLRVRVRLLEDLLLLVLRQQEQIYLQQKAQLVIAKGARADGSAGAAPARPPAGGLPPRAGGPVFAKRGGGGKAHRPGCMFGEKIAKESRVLYPTLAQAIAAGYQPCKVCKP